MKELIDRAINGDSNAYINLINLILSDLFKIARARLDNIEDVNDAIGEIILKSYKYLHKLKHKEYFKTWIIKILINECNNIYRYNQKHIKILDKIINNSRFHAPENAIIINKKNDSFYDLLKDLNYNEKIVIILYYNNGYSTGEIAKILKTNVNTIKSRLLRAKQKIKNNYE